MLWIGALSYGIVWGLYADRSEVDKRVDLAWSFAFPLVVATWVTADARKRGRPLCYDYDTFVFVAWPLVVPVYLFQTRGVRAFLTLGWFAVIWLGTMLVGVLVAAANGNLRL